MVRARKRFGQHFLSDQDVLSRIVGVMAIKPDDRVLEIGPGRGALTSHLLSETDQLDAVEIDRDLVPILSAQFPALKLINADILNVDLHELFHRPTRVVGNLPYNISSPLLLKLADFAKTHPDRFVDGHFMLQKEMAERMSAQPGTKAWGRLSVIMQLTFSVDHLFDVAPESFDPPPKVWSSVIRVAPSDTVAKVSPVEMAAIDEVLRNAFAQRRKRLANALKTLNIDWSLVDVSPDVRADDVTLSQYVALARARLNDQEMDS